MKVLIINGSPRINGNTSIALNEMKKIFTKNNIEFYEYQVLTKDIRGCIACNHCHKKDNLNGGCIFNDDVNKLNVILKESDGIVIASPVYYSSPNGTLISLLDRLFYSCNYDLKMKVGCSLTCCRRGGNSSSLDVLNKYFSIYEMPIVTSTYWNMVYGRKVGEVTQDEEGLQTVRNLASNMVFLMKSIELGKKEIGMEESESGKYTNFIR